jgi:hypothetical protein
VVSMLKYKNLIHFSLRINTSSSQGSDTLNAASPTSEAYRFDTFGIHFRLTAHSSFHTLIFPRSIRLFPQQNSTLNLKANTPGCWILRTLNGLCETSKLIRSILLILTVIRLSSLMKYTICNIAYIYCYSI